MSESDNKRPPSEPRPPDGAIRTATADDEELESKGGNIARIQRDPTVSALEMLLNSDLKDGTLPEGFISLKRSKEEIPIKIRALDSPTHSRCQTKATSKPERDRITGRINEDFDNDLFTFLVMESGVIDPNLEDEKLLDAYRVKTKRDLIVKMFLPGERQLLSQKILELSGFSTVEVQIMRDL